MTSSSASTPTANCSYGKELCLGYLDEEQTAAAFTTDGWYRTGDLTTIAADGTVDITGRLKDVVIRGGENISTAEVEAVLEAHPDVRHAVVVGEPDELMGGRLRRLRRGRGGLRPAHGT